MEGLGIDQSDIDIAKQRLEDMDITILSVTKHIRDLAKGGKAIDVTITGVDQHGEKVTATQQYKQVKTKKGFKTVQTKDIKINQQVGTATKPIDEVNEAYKRMLRIVSDISSIRVELTGLDPEKNTIFIQSHVSAHTELMWILNTMTLYAGLSTLSKSAHCQRCIVQFTIKHSLVVS